MATRNEILAQLASGELGPEEASKKLDEVEKYKQSVLHCKVGPKGGMSLYGLQRRPVTLYLSQWERLLNFVDEIHAFLKEHDKEFRRKGS